MTTPQAARTAAIMQPTYLPYLGYFELIAASEVFIFLDDVQFARRSWQSRNRILLSGQEQMLTIPVRGHDRDTALDSIHIADDQPWRAKHLQSLRHAYAGRPGAAEGLAFMEEQLARPADRLSQFTAGLIEAAASRLGLAPRFVRASDLGCGETRSRHLLALCRAMNVEQYISPRGSEGYMTQEGVFEAEGFPVRFMDFVPQPYEQGSPEFTPYMGFIDAVMNLGWAGTADLVRRPG
ncbi:WbqC family protein [Caulobacter sp. 73W]|uniref:WbqC family protein n=1 Tax=Caulobacter sp. 73W TaxID=3161137 RepID=A0AB39KR21_9CAUL